MVGNDIVDLQLARKESNWNRPRYLQKIFTEEEQDFIAIAPNKHLAIWMLWSRKESAYKIIARRQKRRFYAPKQVGNKLNALSFSTFLEGGQVNFGEQTFITKSSLLNGYIHTTAQLKDSCKSLIVSSFSLDSSDYLNQKKTTRQMLLTSYAKENNLPVADLTIQKDAWKIPHLYAKGRRQMIAVSMSHHGNFGGYALQA